VIVHVVLFEPRADLGIHEQRKILDDVRQAATTIPSLRRLRIGRRVRHGLPGYEQGTTIDYQYIAIFEFEDLEGLRAYLRHPAHEAAGRHFTQSAAHALAYDYEITESS
jgi:hypothetical protein